MAPSDEVVLITGSRGTDAEPARRLTEHGHVAGFVADVASTDASVMYAHTTVTDADVEEFARTFEVNVLGVVNTVHAVLPVRGHPWLPAAAGAVDLGLLLWRVGNARK